ncbi:MAG: hypothetical protein PHS46_07285 [Candidatus Omnitrophica bacterium]|nr:hypothetical protein [Candidatus Omnitrophota bacterium]
MKKFRGVIFQTVTIVFCSFLFIAPAFSESTSTSSISKTDDPSIVAASDATTSDITMPKAEGIVITPQGLVKTTNIQAEPVLKRIDINRISAQPSYETFEGLRLAKYFTIAQRVEIYQEPRPIDAYIMDAKKIRWLHANQPWNTRADFRSQIKPIFTRAYGTEITMSDPKNKEGQWRYTHDYRDIYQNQFPIYREESYRNVNYNHEQWDQNEILWMHAKRIPGCEWTETMNFGYRYSTMNAKNDGSTNAYYETRHTYFAYFSLAPTERFEIFGQFEYFKSRRPKSDFTYNPDHYLYAGELRIKSKDLKTLIVPRVSYSSDDYYPFLNRFSKYEFSFRIGHDFTPKLSATNTTRANFAYRDEYDNKAPTYVDSNPIFDMAGWVGNETRAQYNFYDKLWAQGGFDFAAGTNMCDFDNCGILTGLEYYAPGLIRVDVGYRGNYYYNIEDYMSSIYFKVYFFM